MNNSFTYTTAAAEDTQKKLFAIVWIIVGAVLVAVAVFIPLTQGLGPGSTTIIGTAACIGAPFLAFGIWGLYAELKPYHYERRNPNQ